MENRKTLFYTFEHFPNLEVFGNEIPFKFKKLKEDIRVFENIVLKENPERIIGVTLRKRNSSFETLAINKFGPKGRVVKNGRESYDLNFPTNGFGKIKLAKRPSDTFCNWIIYRIAEIIEKNELETELQFIHIKADDIADLISYFNKLDRI